MDEYESNLGIFSPDGRLIQVEYAQHASNQGGSIVLQSKGDKIVICYETRNINPLLLPMPKMHIIDQERNFYMCFSGLRPDSLKIVEMANSIICNYKFSTSEEISLIKLAREIAEYKQQFTVSHGWRPFGLRSILLGIEDGIAKIFIIETDGNLAEYSRCALGFRSDACNQFLEKDETENCAFKALSKVIQMDYKKVKGFILEKDGLTELSSEQVKKLME
ncbi:Proteasome subunit alpha type-7 [Glugoides intestinalis]